MEKKLAVIVDNNEEITTGNDGTEMCSSGADVAVEMCSPESHDTCGDSRLAHEKSPVNQRFLPIWGENRCVFLLP